VRLSWTAGLLGAFVVCSIASLARPAYGPSFGFGDHYAHMNDARLFPRVGLKLWTTPIDHLFAPMDEARQALAPPDVRSLGDVRDVPGWPATKPFVGSWTSIARPYPPGAMLLVAPIALAYHFTGLSFAAANHLLILLYLAGSQVAFYIGIRQMPDERRRLYAAAWVVAYFYVTFWTLRGFYDAVALIPVLLAASAFEARRWLAVCVALAVGLFIHYRVVFCLPWGLYALWRLARDRAWSTWTAWQWTGAAIGALLAAVSVYTFVLVSPALGLVPLANPTHPGGLHPLPLLVFAASTAAAAVLFWRARAPLDLVMLAWLTLMIVSIRQLQAWHAFMFVPWVLAAAKSDGARFGRILWAVAVTVAVIL